MRKELPALFLFFVLVMGVVVPPCIGASKQQKGNTFDFGEVLLRSEQRHSFTLENRGGGTLSISNARSSCDCLQILSYPIEIKAGKKGQLLVRWIPGEVGPAQHEVILSTHDPEGAELKFAVKGSAKAGATESSVGQAVMDIPPDFFTRKVRKRESSLTVSAETFAKKSRDQWPGTLVDVRGPSEFEKFRIPGSINIPLHALRSKSFLQGKPLILVNEGHSYLSLEEQCKRLKESGFTVSILDGGLYRWKQLGGPLEGDALAQESLNGVSPQAFYLERGYENWVVIDVSHDGQPGASGIIPEAIRVQSSPNTREFASEIKGIQEKNKKRAFLSFLLINERGDDYPRLQRAVQEAGIKSVFVLTGGAEAYRAFLQQQASLRKAAEQPKMTVKKCPSCP